ncbi:unnamed protein product [Linum trigynum]|uniref:Uncharacterized protein n=1 Tax=Linum trigynum TaxID=586398 RepID=A0AAV2DVN5_9ROSI
MGAVLGSPLSKYNPLYWMDENGFWKVWVVDGNSLCSMECWGARFNAGKSGFRAYQKSIPTQANCQFLPKAWNSFEKATLKLRARRTAGNLASTFSPHESLHFLVQKQGIG